MKPIVCEIVPRKDRIPFIHSLYTNKFLKKVYESLFCIFTKLSNN